MNRLGYPRRFAWSTALSGCFGFGGDLVSISNEKEKEFVYTLALKETKCTPAWIGLAFRHQTGGYVWNNGESLNGSVSVTWVGNMSRSFYEDECVEMLKDGWKLSKCCKENKYFICKRPKGELFLLGTNGMKNDGEAPIVPCTTGAQVKLITWGAFLILLNNQR